MAKFAQLASMELDDEASYDAVQPIAMPDKPRFPYGLSISLTDKEFERLGIDPAEALSGVGGLVSLHAIGRVTSANIRNDGDAEGPFCRIEIQIEQLGIDGEAEAAEGELPAPTSRHKRLTYQYQGQGGPGDGGDGGDGGGSG